MPLIQSGISTNAYAQPAIAAGSPHFGMAGTALKAASLASVSDSVHFGGHESRDKDQDVEKGTDSSEARQFTTGQKWQGGGKAMLKSMTNWKWWAREGAIAGGITLATCWLPGSQLFTIPLWLGISGAFTHGKAFVDGYRNPDAVGKIDSAKAKEHQATQQNREGWGKGEIAKAMLKGAWDNGKRTFMLKNGDLLQNLGISALLTLATCWLPGSQLLTIPAWFCMDAAIKAGMGGYHGWQNPAHYVSQKH